ncbi:OmpH family outer membrane protein [Hugenholtzia roseola]|uniref:OmpH family outer membrane protein n=1 Tax=Hugenholtzia roseola TaxID=1002 RepID=UPI0004069A2B|nr:OmpH family outer membrane protein [Hugenholtzia roseola]
MRFSKGQLPKLNPTALLLFAFFGFWGFFSQAKAQRFGYVDTQKILALMPEYQAALKDLETQRQLWEKELKQKESDLLEARLGLEAERVLLSKSMQQEREATLRSQTEAVLAFREQIFGFEGAFFQKRRQLVEPLQARVMEAVRIVAVQKKLHFIFDKASDFHMLYHDTTYDFTDFVLDELGIKIEKVKSSSGEDTKQATKEGTKG